ncbi:MAG: hypothetical protein HUJ91_03480 [Bacteroidales bacterium]|nr:hypothetical protein [Bacteroidales bacterium]
MKNSGLIWALMALAPAMLSAQEVETEFRLAIYRNASQAELTVVVPEGDDAAKNADVSILSETGDEVWSKSYELEAGTNSCMVDIEGWNAGRYMATIVAGRDTCRRMLRIERIPEVQIPEGPITLRTLFFTPDNYLYRTPLRNLAVKETRAELTEVGRTPSEDGLAFMPKAMYRAEDGSFVVQCTDYEWKHGLLYEYPRPYNMGAATPEGPYSKLDTLPRVADYGIYDEWKDYDMHPARAKQDKYEMYDPAKHGTYRLQDVSYIQQLEPHDFGCVQAGTRSYWLVVPTSSGEVVMLRDTPLFVDIPLYSGDEFDNGFTTNDNFGNYWLSEDGGTLYHLRGQTVRRFAPYDVPYDMVPNSLRIMTVYSTTDGINWEYLHSISCPGTDRTPGEQHYGCNVYYMEDAGVYIAILETFDGDAQRAFFEIRYSRDGVNFHEIEEGSYFARDDNYGSWAFGQLYCEGQPQKFGDKLYFLISANPMDHTQFEGYFRKPRLKDVTADDFRRAFANRQYERLTHFEKAGGWEGIAANTREGYFAVGLASIGIDRWFGLEAGRRAGSFATRDLAGQGGRLSVNADVRKGGYVKVKLISESGKRKFTLRENASRAEAFELPSEGTYCLKVKMKKANLYAFYLN